MRVTGAHHTESILILRLGIIIFFINNYKVLVKNFYALYII